MNVQRRSFLTLVGGAAAAWPIAARAQQAERVRRIAILSGADGDDPTYQSWLAAFREELEKFGWIVGRNIRIDHRWGGDRERLGLYAAELISLAPDVIVGFGPGWRQIQEKTQSIPIVGVGLTIIAVRNIARPEGNLTGFNSNVETFGGKWVDLLKKAVPYLTRVAWLYDPDLVNVSIAPTLPSMRTAAAALAVELLPIPGRDATEIDHALAAFASEPNGGLIVQPPISTYPSFAIYARSAMKYRLPAISFDRHFPQSGGLMGFGPDYGDLYRKAASYVNRILRGAKPSELPVQLATKLELVINLKTARALDLEIPPGLLAIVDEVIE